MSKSLEKSTNTYQHRVINKGLYWGFIKLGGHRHGAVNKNDSLLKQTWQWEASNYEQKNERATGWFGGCYYDYMSVNMCNM